MPRRDGTGPMGQGAGSGRGLGRCVSQETAARSSPTGGGRRRLRMRMGQGRGRTTEEMTASSSVQRSDCLASDQGIAELRQQVRQLTETVQALTHKMDEPRKPASPPA